MPVLNVGCLAVGCGVIDKKTQRRSCAIVVVVVVIGVSAFSLKSSAITHQIDLYNDNCTVEEKNL